MIGFAVVDNTNPNEVAIWLVSRTSPDEVHNTNAVVVDSVNDPEASTKIGSLIADRAVLLTAGSSAETIPVTEPALATADLAELITEADLLHTQITAAVEAYAVRPDPKTGKCPKKPRPLVMPDPPAHPREDAFRPRDSQAPHRALATANYLLSMWRAWLQIESERVRRARSSKGELWMMPEELAAPEIAPFPPSFATKVRPQPMTTAC